MLFEGRAVRRNIPLHSGSKVLRRDSNSAYGLFKRKNFWPPLRDTALIFWSPTTMNPVTGVQEPPRLPAAVSNSNPVALAGQERIRVSSVRLKFTCTVDGTIVMLPATKAAGNATVWGSETWRPVGSSPKETGVVITLGMGVTVNFNTATSWVPALNVAPVTNASVSPTRPLAASFVFGS